MTLPCIHVSLEPYNKLLHSFTEENNTTTEENVENYTHPIRKRNPPKHLEDYSHFVREEEEEMRNHDCMFLCRFNNVPNTYKQAMRSSEVEKWKSAMKSEMTSLAENNTYSIVPLPAGKKAVGSRWVYSLKQDPEGNTTHKARFVAKGFSQIPGSDYLETFSPTPKMTTIRLLMQFSAEKDLMVHQLDVRTAYLNAPIDFEVYINQPEGFKKVSETENLVCKLHKSLYGLKQSGRNWNIVLNKFFQKSGYSQSKADPCLYFKIEDHTEIFIVVWVDDIVVAANTEQNLSTIKDKLKDQFRMKDLGRISWFLGIQFRQTEDGIEIDQSFYLRSILARFQMSDCNPRKTPCETKPESYEAVDVTDQSEEDVRKYREVVGSLVYAMTCTRPDLAWVVTKLSQHLSKPTSKDWMMVKHVLRYLKGTMERKLKFSKSTNGLKLRGFSDSDWGGSEDKRSTTGYLFCLNDDGGAVSWKSRKQPTVALSTCEAEYMALVATTQEALFLKTLVKDFGLSCTEPIQLHGDNQGAISLVKNPVTHEKSKHIDIKFHFIREKFSEGLIEVDHVPTGDNVADVMTKPPTKVKLDHFKRTMFGGHQL